MFSVGLFYFALGTLCALLAFRHIESLELGEGQKYFSRMRLVVDSVTERMQFFVRRNFALHAMTSTVNIWLQIAQHYTARVVAFVGHVLEHRARRVVHRTAKRVRTEGHYLEKDVPTSEAPAPLENEV
jgi:hypothetical protein